MIHDYMLAFGCYWFGFLTCAALVMGRERHDSNRRGLSSAAEPTRTSGGGVQTKPASYHVLETAPAPAEAVVVGDILKAKTRVSRAKKNGEVK